MKAPPTPNEARRARPPLYSVLAEIVGWTLDRTASIPKSQRFTFGQRLDGLTLDAFQSVVKATFASDAGVKREALSDLLLALEQLGALWRLVQERGWISLQQLVYIGGRLDEAGRMASGWRRQQARKASAPGEGQAIPSATVRSGRE